MNTTIISAGPYRSGSTWLYNAIRLLIGDCWAGFVHKQSDMPPEDSHNIRLIKCHKYLWYISKEADIVFSIYRKISDVKASMERRALVATEGFTNEAKSELFDTYFHNSCLWYIEADLIVLYEDVILAPLHLVTKINLKLLEKGVCDLRSKKEREDIVEQLKNLEIPEKGSNPVTLLHSNHITKKTW